VLGRLQERTLGSYILSLRNANQAA